jgi:hypothetical protein
MHFEFMYTADDLRELESRRDLFVHVDSANSPRPVED